MIGVFVMGLGFRIFEAAQAFGSGLTVRAVVGRCTLPPA